MFLEIAESPIHVLTQAFEWDHLIKNKSQGTIKELKQGIDFTFLRMSQGTPKELPRNCEGTKTTNWVHLVEQVLRNYQGIGKELKQRTEFIFLQKGQGTPGELGRS